MPAVSLNASAYYLCQGAELDLQVLKKMSTEYEKAKELTIKGTLSLFFLFLVDTGMLQSGFYTFITCNCVTIYICIHSSNISFHSGNSDYFYM